MCCSLICARLWSPFRFLHRHLCPPIYLIFLSVLWFPLRFRLFVPVAFHHLDAPLLCSQLSSPHLRQTDIRARPSVPKASASVSPRRSARIRCFLQPCPSIPTHSPSRPLSINPTAVLLCIRTPTTINRLTSLLLLPPAHLSIHTLIHRHRLTCTIANHTVMPLPRRLPTAWTTTSGKLLRLLGSPLPQHELVDNT